MTHPFAAQRALFPILAHKAQLSSCSQSALSVPVINAMAECMQSWQERGMDWGGWDAALQAAKAEFAQLIGAQAQNIAVMSCVSDLASSAAQCLSFDGERNAIVLGEAEFLSLGHVWLAQRARGAQLRHVQGPDPAQSGGISPTPDHCAAEEVAAALHAIQRCVA